MRTWALPLDGVHGDVAVAAGSPAGMSGRESTLGVLVEDDAMMETTTHQKSMFCIYIPQQTQKGAQRRGKRRQLVRCEPAKSWCSQAHGDDGSARLERVQNQRLQMLREWKSASSLKTKVSAVRQSQGDLTLSQILLGSGNTLGSCLPHRGPR